MQSDPENVAYPSLDNTNEKKTLLARQQPTSSVPLITAQPQSTSYHAAPRKNCYCLYTIIGGVCTFMCFILAMLLIIKMSIISFAQLRGLSHEVVGWSPAHNCSLVAKNEISGPQGSNVTFLVTFWPVFHNRSAAASMQIGYWYAVTNANNATVQDFFKHEGKFLQLNDPQFECWYKQQQQDVVASWQVTMFPYGSQMGMLLILGICGLILGCCCVCCCCCGCGCTTRNAYKWKNQRM